MMSANPESTACGVCANAALLAITVITEHVETSATLCFIAPLHITVFLYYFIINYYILESL